MGAHARGTVPHLTALCDGRGVAALSACRPPGYNGAVESPAKEADRDRNSSATDRPPR